MWRRAAHEDRSVVRVAIAVGLLEGIHPERFVTYLGPRTAEQWQLLNDSWNGDVEATRRHRSAWESDGRPRGFFWSPAEATAFGSYFAQQRLSLAWVFSTPHWARQDPAAARSLKHLRRLVLVWNVAMVVAAAVVWFWGVGLASRS